MLANPLCCSSADPPVTAVASSSMAMPTVLMGVNLASANFGAAWPGSYGVDYIYPNADELDYYKSKGLTLIRLPFSWIRMQPKLYEGLDATQLRYLNGFLAEAAARNMPVILDAHDFGRYQPLDPTSVIGSPQVPISAFHDFWTRMAAQFAHTPVIHGYDIMNEPHDMDGAWPAAAQSAIDGIRSVDQNTPIIIEGDGWAATWSWRQLNGDLDLHDPSNRLVYSGHLYFDHDDTGHYKGGYDAEGAYPTIGVDRLRPFLEWLEQHHHQGFVGEYGVPRNDTRWLIVLDKFLGALTQAGLPGTYWAAGPWWGPSDPLSVEPIDGRDKPQMAILEKYPSAAR